MSNPDPSRSPASDRDDQRRPSTAPRADAPLPADQLRSEAAARQADSADVDQEQVLWTGGYSGRAMVGTWIGLILLSVAAVVGTALSAGAVPWVATALGLLAIWLIVAGVYGLRRMGVHYELTSQRFLHQTGVVTRRTDRIEVIDIDDVSFVQGLVQRMMGVGTIRISSSDRSHPELELHGIANVREVAGLIDDTRRKERRRRSLHIESI